MASTSRTSNSSRTGEDRILLAIKMEGGPLKQSELAAATGLRHTSVKYWLPRMIKKGTLLELHVDGVTLYASQPILHSGDLEGVLNTIFKVVLENVDDFFVFDQAEVEVADVIKTNIAKVLKMYCLTVRDLDKDDVEGV